MAATATPTLDAGRLSAYLAGMAILTVIAAPDPRLKARCRKVAAVDDDTRRLMDDMLETMYRFVGIGLAAPQVGVAKRIVVCDVARRDEPPRPLKLVNPEVVWESADLEIREEGCLSVPEHYADVERPSEVRVRYLDERGESREIHANGVLSVCLQHEIEHLDGVLFIDHLSALKRDIILRKLGKARRIKATEPA
jgi:peptide deformylase